MVIGTLMPSPNCPTYDECVSHYVKVEQVFIGVGAVGFVSGLILNVVDFRNKYQVLNWTEAKVAAAMAEDAAKEEGASLLSGEDRKQLRG
jgi:hypothetical protein